MSLFFNTATYPLQLLCHPFSTPLRTLSKALGIDESAFLSYIKAMPFQFYSIMAVVMVPIVVMARADFGPMKKAETDYTSGTKFENDDVSDEQTLPDDGRKNAKPIMVWLPLSIMLVIMFSLLIPQGFPLDMANMPSNAFRASLSTGYVCAALALMC